MATVFLPPQWRDLAGGRDQVEAHGRTLREILRELDRQFPGIARQVREGDSIAPGLAVSVDGSVTNRGLLTPIGPESEIHFLPAIGGG